MLNFLVNIPVLKNNYFKSNSVSFSGSISKTDVFTKTSENMKKAWVYKTPVRNPIIREEFEKHFLEDTHSIHDDKNGTWYISEKKDGPNSIYYAAQQHPLKIREIRAFGKKGKIVKCAGSVAKFAKLKFDKNSETYVAEPVRGKTKDGYKNMFLHYKWIEEQAKMFLVSVTFEEIS